MDFNTLALFSEFEYCLSCVAFEVWEELKQSDVEIVHDFVRFAPAKDPLESRNQLGFMDLSV